MRITQRPLTPRARSTEPSKPATAAAAPSTSAQGWAPKSIRGAAPAERSGPPDGKKFCDAALIDIKARTARGEKVRVVFDIDDTLSESRARTLVVAKEWDQANGTHHFDRLVVAQVGQNGTETAKALNLPDPVGRDFQAHWDLEFWKGESFVHDTPIAPMVKLAKQAKAAGAEVIFLTGRVDALEVATIAQLQRFGLKDVNSETVVSKADLSVRTGPFKTQWLQQSEAAGNHLAFFITESRRDVAAVQQGFASAPTVLLSSAFGGTEALRDDTPIFPK